MKNLITIFGAFFISSLVLTSCGTDDPKENGEKAGEIRCEAQEVEEAMDDISDDIQDLDWDDDDERAEIADLQMEMADLEKELYNLRMEYISLENKQWTAIEDEDDIDEWLEDFQEAMDDYIEENCEEKRDR